AVSARLPAHARAIALQRAFVSFVRGDVRAALVPLEAGAWPRAIGGRHGLFYRRVSPYNQPLAIRLRAVLRAPSGDDDGARSDIRAVRASAAEPTIDDARATLAEALVLARGEDRAVLRDLLDRDAALCSLLTPRERLLFRGLERCRASGGAGVYRI